MAKLIFVIGGARSGKSAFARELAESMGKDVVYLATAEVIDEEMALRIARHKAERPPHWQTIEEPNNLKRIAQILQEAEKLVLLDCLTLLLSNMLLKENIKNLYKKEDKLTKDFSSLAEAVSKAQCSAIFVANEVGMGICPENYLARAFRDIAGRINQEITKRADEVYFLRAGIAEKIKPEFR